MKKLDPKLLKRLEERDDANEVLAEMLGVCPTCGQIRPTGATPKPPKQRIERPPRGGMRTAIIEYLTKVDTAFGNQSRCARKLDSSVPYVNKIWVEYRRLNGVDPPKLGVGTAAIVGWLRENPKQNQSDCARHFGVTRQAVSMAVARGIDDEPEE